MDKCTVMNKLSNATTQPTFTIHVCLVVVIDNDYEKAC